MIAKTSSDALSSNTRFIIYFLKRPRGFELRLKAWKAFVLTVKTLRAHEAERGRFELPNLLRLTRFPVGRRDRTYILSFYLSIQYQSSLSSLFWESNPNFCLTGTVCDLYTKEAFPTWSYNKSQVRVKDGVGFEPTDRRNDH